MKELDLQKITFFTEGNHFTGERTKESGNVLRYLVKPDFDSNQLLTFAWNRDVCYEKAEITAQKEFPLSEEGLDEIQVWLQEQYANC